MYNHSVKSKKVVNKSEFKISYFYNKHLNLNYFSFKDHNANMTLLTSLKNTTCSQLNQSPPKCYLAKPKSDYFPTLQ